MSEAVVIVVAVVAVVAVAVVIGTAGTCTGEPDGLMDSNEAALDAVVVAAVAEDIDDRDKK